MNVPYGYQATRLVKGNVPVDINVFGGVRLPAD